MDLRGSHRHAQSHHTFITTGLPPQISCFFSLNVISAYNVCVPNDSVIVIWCTLCFSFIPHMLCEHVFEDVNFLGTIKFIIAMS